MISYDDNYSDENKEEERIYSNFINSLRSPVTKEQYATALKHYMKRSAVREYVVFT